VTELRAQVLAQRRALSPEDVARFSREVTARFQEWAGNDGGLLSGRQVSLYSEPMKGEARLESLASWLQGQGAVLCFPRVSGLEMSMVSADGRVVPPGELALVIVPGVVFGENGERIGMGKGHYDRYLPTAPQAVRVALPFDFQLRSRIEQSPWDQRVDVLITPTRIIELPARARA
jgi:5-formyltetrahydrofolate cyclo-ligase